MTARTGDPATRPGAAPAAGGSAGSDGVVVKRRLPQRPPPAVRRARTVLLVHGVLMFIALAIGLLLLTGSVLRGPLVFGGLGYLAVMGVASVVTARRMRHRNRIALLAGLAIAGVLVVLNGYILFGLATGALGVTGNLAFFAFIATVIPAVLGLIIGVNLLASLRWFRPDPLERPVGLARNWWTATTQQEGRENGTGPLLVVEGLKKHFPIYGGLLRRQIATVYAVDGVDFEVRQGEVLSLVGESGCGKTTLGRSLLQLTPPTAGRVIFEGYELTDVDQPDMIPLRRRMQIIFQDPFGSLNPRMPVSDIIGEGLLAQGVKDRKTRDKLVEDSLENVGLRREYTRRYPHEFSGGQRQRIGIARALALRPDFIVCDEPVSALDVSIQSQVLNLLLDLRRDFNLTYLFISHNLSVVEYVSDRVGVMYLGKIVELATAVDLYREPRHPYSVALLSAVPAPDPRRRRKRLVLRGDVPSPVAPPSGCRFHTRCWLREQLGNPERCVTEEPLLRDVGGGHQAACHYAEEISTDRIGQAAKETSALQTAVAVGEE
ncbi:MAG TPA: oligopeptide/dipeptide ABC transporter ATP-binding protein [Candidatus Limnocylindrales bacterium]|jgi:oligopeptide/dipeptide ABC transporter ATP-binding protein